MHNLVEPSLQPKINELFEVTLRGDADSGVCGGGSEGREGLNRPLLTVISRGDGGSRGLGRDKELWQVPADLPCPLQGSLLNSRGGNINNLSSNTKSAVGIDRSSESLQKNSGNIAALDDSCSSKIRDYRDTQDGLTLLSMMLPCRRFPTKQGQFWITVRLLPPSCQVQKAKYVYMVSIIQFPQIDYFLSPPTLQIILMNDTDPSKRCFYCILAPPPTSFPSSIKNHYSTKSNSHNDWKTVKDLEGSCLPVDNGTFARTHETESQMLGKIRMIGQRTLASLL